MAAQHRLEPHLHARLERGELHVAPPPAIAACWREAFRRQAVLALAQRQALLEAIAALQRAGIASVALKGAWLAPCAYPHPAERPMRDCDLLVTPARLSDAYRVLLQEGWQASVDDPGQHIVPNTAHRHLPPLYSPAGVALELHGHCWRPEDNADGGGTRPVPIDERLSARAWADDDRVRYPAAPDMLAHLCVHATYLHALNVGPLLLADIDYLLAANVIDWPAFWRDAQAGRYLPGAALAIALTDRWRRPGLIAQSGCPLPIAADTLADASRLLCQDIHARKDIALGGALLHSWRRRGWQGLGKAMQGRALADVREFSARSRFIERLGRTGEAVRGLANPSTRLAATQTATLLAFLRRS